MPTYPVTVMFSKHLHSCLRIYVYSPLSIKFFFFRISKQTSGLGWSIKFGTLGLYLESMSQWYLSILVIHEALRNRMKLDSRDHLSNRIWYRRSKKNRANISNWSKSFSSSKPLSCAPISDISELKPSKVFSTSSNALWIEIFRRKNF